MTIAMKCLEKEAARRYQSAAALGEDIQRYLSDQPILARPPSTAYQFRKLVLRHKGPLADLTGNQQLPAIIDREEARVLSRLQKIRERFADEPVKVLLVTGPSNEISVGKILAEFGAGVVIVPTMRNAFAQQEMNILRERYGSRIAFHEDDFDTVAHLADVYKPDVIFADFQARVEVVQRLIPCLINENYLNEYGYDYATRLRRALL